jgi:3-oxoacyl-ACP reductase-like protein
MSFFDKIKGAIFGKAEAATPAPTSTPAPTGAPTTAASPAAPAPTASAPASTAPASTGSVDVASILDAAVKQNGQKLDWKRSIVDLLKALDLDSSLSARKELASELGYTGDTSDSATMNIWLHKAVIKKLSENGGKVPADLLH